MFSCICYVFCIASIRCLVFIVFFFFNDPATTEIYTSLFVGSVNVYKRQACIPLLYQLMPAVCSITLSYDGRRISF